MNINIVATYCENDRYIWCVAQEDAYLYRLDKEDGILEQMIPLLDDVYVNSAFINILHYRNWLVFVPSNAKCIVLVDYISFEKQYIEFLLYQFLRFCL